MCNFKFDYSLLNHFCVGSKTLAFIAKRNEAAIETYVTESIYELTGYTNEEIKKLQDNHYSLIYDEDSSEVKRSLIEFESNPHKNSLELIYRIVSKSGELVWIKDQVYLEREEEKIKLRKSSLLNISDVKQREAFLEAQNESLKELNSQKDKFISIISHDLRSPFTTLLGFSEILLNEEDVSEEERIEYLKYIYDASKTQLNLINCLLDWSRLQTGRIKVEPVRLNVKHVITTAIAPLTGDAIRKNIDVKVDIASDLSINADERLIGQAFVHLVSNAIKFTPEGKDVHISASRFKEGLVEIVIRDEGLGISEENQNKLFRIDQKFSLRGTSGEKGSGLGLTLVKEIIDKHNGQVWFYSQVSEGSEFHLTVPEAKNIILLVEDDLAARELFKKMIEQELNNFEVRFAANGYEAINVYRELLPTLVITDHDMPLMNGIQLVEAIQKKETGKSFPFIVLSANMNEDISKRYSKIGVDKLLSKPVEHALLIKSIKECLY
ncbi:MAG: PAS/PAC sensor hybrid histidine kinase [Ignavibacteria bacterium]|nr:MAG: PAS/PAC sensor hybrid histidine kinase [Ignavibacteria bacterium]KAF0158875.1 MAG: PAS/PAC sensor hybrid histidine kinase [Ignavibacteria bacterium]